MRQHRAAILPELVQCKQDGDEHSEAALNGSCPRQSALEHVNSGFFVSDNVLELRFDYLSVVVGDEVFEWVLVALETLALVAASLEATALNRDALEKEMGVSLLFILKNFCTTRLENTLSLLCLISW